MKNIHLIPTKPNDETGGGLWIKDTRDWCHIYISSDEDIKVYDYITDGYKVWQWRDDSSLLGRKKIILTSDPGFIQYGVQPIDDEFFGWWIKNPSVEAVDIESWQTKGESNLDYKVIIPKEEVKQEVIEEPADRMYNYEDLKDICERYHNMMCLYGKSKTEDWFEFKFKK